MKKFLAYFTAILFVGVLTLSVLAFSDDDPKKQKTEATTTGQCEKHTETTSGTTKTKACCQKAGATTDAACPKSAECKNHSETPAEVK